MNLLSALLGEHAVLKHQIDLLRRIAPELPDALLASSARFLGSAVERHATIEDELLFVPLAAPRLAAEIDFRAELVVLGDSGTLVLGGKP